MANMAINAAPMSAGRTIGVRKGNRLKIKVETKDIPILMKELTAVAFDLSVDSLRATDSAVGLMT